MKIYKVYMVSYGDYELEYPPTNQLHIQHRETKKIRILNI